MHLWFWVTRALCVAGAGGALCLFAYGTLGYFGRPEGYPMRLRVLLVAGVLAAISLATPILRDWSARSTSEPVLELFAAALFTSAAALFRQSLRAHDAADPIGTEPGADLASVRASRPAVSWTQRDPARLVDWGPYAWVRHPIYLSYLLAWTGTAILTHRPWAWLVLGGMAALYHAAARDEEAGFLRGRLSLGYLRYRAEVPMLFPRLGMPHRGSPAAATGK